VAIEAIAGGQALCASSHAIASLAASDSQLAMTMGLYALLRHLPFVDCTKLKTSLRRGHLLFFLFSIILV